jgi:pimeloyl-ACP methyl ester carboxylesterase
VSAPLTSHGRVLRGAHREAHGGSDHRRPPRAHATSDIDQAVRALYRGMVLPESMRLSRGVYKRMRLTIPTLVAFGRLDTRFNELLIRRLWANPERFADRVEFAFVDDAERFIPDDAPDTVANLMLD